jgi:hypothetical protein
MLYVGKVQSMRDECGGRRSRKSVNTPTVSDGASRGGGTKSETPEMELEGY